MKDVFYTLVVVWLIYRLVDVFRSVQKKKEAPIKSSSRDNLEFPERDLKKAATRRFDKEGDYVDYEDIK